MDPGFPAFVPIAVFTVFVLVLIALTTLRRITALDARMTTIRLMDKKIDLLMQHAGVKFDPFANVPPDVVEATRQGQKIKAIKLYRQETGIGLKEAKDFIEDLQQKNGLA